MNVIAASYRKIFRGWFHLESRCVAMIYNGAEDKVVATGNLRVLKLILSFQGEDLILLLSISNGPAAVG